MTRRRARTLTEVGDIFAAVEERYRSAPPRDWPPVPPTSARAIIDVLDAASIDEVAFVAVQAITELRRRCVGSPDAVIELAVADRSVGRALGHLRRVAVAGTPRRWRQ